MSLFKDVIPSLITKDPIEGRELAIMIVRKTIASIQQDPDVRKKLRPQYAEDPMALIESSKAVALEFQTIAAANNYWKD